MPRTEITGFSGAADSPTGCKFDIVAWSATLSIEQIKIPPAFGTKWTKTALGPGEFTGSLRGTVVFDASSTNPMDLDASATSWSNLSWSATLTATTGCTFTGTLVLYNIAVERPNGGLMTITADFANAAADMADTWDVSG